MINDPNAPNWSGQRGRIATQDFYEISDINLRSTGLGTCSADVGSVSPALLAFGATASLRGAERPSAMAIAQRGFALTRARGMNGAGGYYRTLSGRRGKRPGAGSIPPSRRCRARRSGGAPRSQLGSVLRGFGGGCPRMNAGLRRLLLRPARGSLAQSATLRSEQSSVGATS